MPIDPGKLSFCSLNINCYFTDITVSSLFLQSSRTLCHIISYQCSLIMQRYKLMLETNKIDWDSFKFNVEALDETSEHDKCSFKCYFRFKS